MNVESLHSTFTRVLTFMASRNSESAVECLSMVEFCRLACAQAGLHGRTRVWTVVLTSSASLSAFAPASPNLFPSERHQKR